VKPVTVFAAGAVVGALVAVLLVRAPAPSRKRANIWRERAEQIQIDLATVQNQRDALAGELRKLTERFTLLSERFDALSATVAAVVSPTPQVTPPALARTPARAP
jgi:gas vesicle protein